MSFWSRIANTFRPDSLNQELDEEFEAHIAEAIEQGRDPLEARRAFGKVLRQREASRQFRVASWLDGLRSDIIFGGRQLRRNKITSAAAVLSLALAMGACTSAFRIIDALLLRPLPVAAPERLYDLSRSGLDWDGMPSSFDYWAYPAFALMRDAAGGQARLIALSGVDRDDLTFSSDDEMEKANIQYVSGSTFDVFGLQPALGRLLSPSDDQTPGAHPVAVLSYQYWTRRFANDPKVIGQNFRNGKSLYQIIGVGPEPFTGTEPGTITDVFLPTMMHRSVTKKDATWHRTFASVSPGTSLEPLRAKLDAVSRNFETERSKEFKGMPQQAIDNYLNQRLDFLPASSGVSGMQSDYRQSLQWLAILVLLVLLIACANVANLMTALASSRAREMALRVSIGAGRLRLVQMVLVESALLAAIAATLGALFAWPAAPLVIRLISSPDNPTQLVLPADWRVLGFGLVLVVAVMLLFGLLPALRASSIKPVSALKGGEDPHSRRRLMHAMIALQVGFCFLVVFTAGLFLNTFERLSHRPLGYDSHGLLLLETISANGAPPTAWSQVADSLRTMPGVEQVAQSGWPLMTSSWNNSISVNGGPPSIKLSQFLPVSPNWFATMRMPILAGRDFRSSDTSPGAAIVNQAFVNQFLKDPHPVGRYFVEAGDDGGRTHYQVIGVVTDAPYRNLRESVPPVAFLPLLQLDAKAVVQSQLNETFVLRTSVPNPLQLGTELRRKVAHSHAGFRVSNVRTQQSIIDGQTIRERLLAMLGEFFAAVALLLAGIGLYGVLNYSVLQRRREIGIRVAVGACGPAVARLVTKDVFAMVTLGLIAGLVFGVVSARSMQTMFYQVKISDPAALITPLAVILIVAILATIPAILRALKIEPAEILRSE